jgi:hypothetical protein
LPPRGDRLRELPLKATSAHTDCASDGVEMKSLPVASPQSPDRRYNFHLIIDATISARYWVAMHLISLDELST